MTVYENVIGSMSHDNNHNNHKDVNAFLSVIIQFKT